MSEGIKQIVYPVTDLAKAKTSTPSCWAWSPTRMAATLAASGVLTVALAAAARLFWAPEARAA